MSADWKALHDTLGIPEVKHSGLGVLYFAVFELGRGLVSMFLYVMMRPHFKPGPKTAALAGVVAWIAFSVTGPAQFIPLGFFSNALWIKVAAFQLVTSIVAAVAGAACTRTHPTHKVRGDVLRPINLSQNIDIAIKHGSRYK